METVIDRKTIDDITARYQALVSLVPLRTIRSQRSYKQAVTVLNQLLDAGAANERSPLAGLADTLGSVIGDYENLQIQAPAITPVMTLRFLMEQHNLSQSELPEVGTQGVVSEVLRGRRDLNVRQIRALAERFQVPAQLFI